MRMGLRAAKPAAQHYLRYRVPGVSVPKIRPAMVKLFAQLRCKQLVDSTHQKRMLAATWKPLRRVDTCSGPMSVLRMIDVKRKEIFVVE
jgi:hypothetical protein